MRLPSVALVASCGAPALTVRVAGSGSFFEAFCALSHVVLVAAAAASAR